MCGIFGWRRWGQARRDVLVEDLRGAYLENENRGRNASGAAWLDGGVLRIAKAPVKATDFLESGLIPTEAWHSPLGLLHTRATTKGSEKINENNHPIQLGEWAVVHNGVITNDDSVFEHFQCSKPGEATVDTLALPLLLGRGGEDIVESVRHLTLLGGSAAAAAYSTQRPDELLLFRVNGNPIYLTWLEEANALVFSSSSASMAWFAAPILGGKLRSGNYTVLADDTALLLGATPEATRMWRIKTRNPVYVARAKTPTPIAPHVGSTPTRASVTPAPAAAAGTRVRWESLLTKAKEAGHDCAALLGKRPPPELSGLTVFHDYRAALEELAHIPATQPHAVSTAYGRWVSPPELGAFRFRPRKGVRKWTRREKLPAWWEQTAAEYKPRLDRRLPAEPISFSTSTDKKVTVLSHGYLCAWCGAALRRADLTTSEEMWQCPWCQIVLLNPHAL